MKQSEILELLPYVVQITCKSDNPLGVLLSLMEELHRPAEDILDTLDSLFDPRRTRDDMVRFLAYWINLEWLTEDLGGKSVRFLIEPGRLRELIANAAYISKWRGTARGLQTFLSVALGAEEVQIEENTSENSVHIPFHLSVKMPRYTEKFSTIIHQIIKKEKPAYATYELHFV